MPLFKTVNSDRSQKKFVVAENLEVLKCKAAQKLGLEKADKLMVVMETDGTEVDEDEVLVELNNKELLMVLTPGESWSPCVTVTQNPDDEAGSPEPTIQMAESPDYTIIVQPQLQQEQQHQQKNDSTIELECYIDGDTPPFSALVKQHFQDNAIELVWNKFIGEAANFYYGLNPDTSSAYQKIGQQMYMKYPCIRQEGAYPWTFFIKSLSQKIRHMRLNLKRKSILVGSPRVSKTMKVVSSTSVRQTTVSSEQDEKAHIEELQDEWKKPAAKRSATHIRTLLKETKSARGSLLKSSGRILKEVIESFPCFQDGEFVLYELKQMLQADRFTQMVENMEVMIRACHNLMGIPLGPNDLNEDKQNTVAIDARVMKALHHVEAETKFDRSKKGKKHFLSAIQVHDSDDVPAKLKTLEGDPPALVMFQDEVQTEYSAAYIVGDEVSIQCYNTCIMVHMIQLLGVYYIFDLDYPKQYAMFLGVLQQFVLNEPFTRESSKRFKFFCKKLRPEFEKVKANFKSHIVEN